MHFGETALQQAFRHPQSYPREELALSSRARAFCPPEAAKGDVESISKVFQETTCGTLFSALAVRYRTCPAPPIDSRSTGMHRFAG